MLEGKETHTSPKARSRVAHTPGGYPTYDPRLNIAICTLTFRKQTPGHKESHITIPATPSHQPGFEAVI